MVEKKARESSGRDAATGVVLGGERLKVLLALEESANAETDDWIWDTGAALMSPVQRSLARKRFPSHHGEGSGATEHPERVECRKTLRTARF